MKIRPVDVKLFYAGGRADGRTDTTKLTVVFRNFANAPNKNGKKKLNNKNERLQNDTLYKTRKGKAQN
jgi:hypothetical protein